MKNPIQTSDSSDQKPHFVLIPVMAQGHMIPMIDMAHVLANHGAVVTLVTTPLNASRIQTIIDGVETTGLPIRFLPLRFPCAEVGLPEGCENVDALPSRDLMINFLEGCRLLLDPLVLYLREQHPTPSCIISDITQPWTQKVAREFGIPRFSFSGSGCFALLCRHIIHHKNIMENVTDENEPVIIPGLPHRIEITQAQSPGSAGGPGMDKFREEVMEVDSTSDGFVVNTFDDLEPSYVECYQKAMGKKVWTIGPLSLYNRDVTDLAVRGNKASIDENQCVKWLDSMKPSSVLYVSFGSMVRTVPSQLIEVGLGLEASNCPFVWVIKAGDKSSEVEEWLSEGFLERTRERGLIIRGWAPQVMILSHPAIGGFMTHCGWNSTLESVSAGLPMITWPHFAEQFLNEKLIVDILRIGFSIGVKAPTKFLMENNEVLVDKNGVEKAVRMLMDKGEESKELTEKARELGKKARKAMEEGSSYQNTALLVQKIIGTNQLK